MRRRTMPAPIRPRPIIPNCIARSCSWQNRSSFDRLRMSRRRRCPLCHPKRRRRLQSSRSKGFRNSTSPATILQPGPDSRCLPTSSRSESEPSSVTRRSAVLVTLTLAAAVAGSLLMRPAAAAGRPFTVDQILGFPFPEHLVAAQSGAVIAWTFNERGVRNVYVAQGPDFAPRALTRYASDDGQELTNLSFSDDGRYLVFVRGGNHEAHEADVRPPPNPTSSPVQPKMEVWSIATAGGDAKLLGEGDVPVVAPRSH